MSRRVARCGLTLIELLVVIFIIVLFVAVAAPLFRPATEDRKVREASRQLNAYFAEAKALAAQRARPVALTFDRASAVGEGARDSNLVTRLHLAEVPPTYSGDLLGASVGMWQGVNVPNFTPKAIQINNNPPTPPIAANAIMLDFAHPGLGGGFNSMVDVIAASYFRNPAQFDCIPFTIRFGGRGSYYLGCCMYNPTPPPGIPGRTYHYFCWAPYGTQLHSRAMPAYQPPPVIPPLASYEINFPPQVTADTGLELPTGAVVDLQFSGLGQSGTEFFDDTHAFRFPVVVMFNPSGDVSAVQTRGLWLTPTGRIHFLVGTLEKAINAVDAANPTLRNATTSNIADTANQWVSLSSRTGHVTTADNISFTEPALAPNDPLYIPTIMAQARAFATGLNTKGGR